MATRPWSQEWKGARPTQRPAGQAGLQGLPLCVGVEGRGARHEGLPRGPEGDWRGMCKAQLGVLGGLSVLALRAAQDALDPSLRLREPGTEGVRARRKTPEKGRQKCGGAGRVRYLRKVLTEDREKHRDSVSGSRSERWTGRQRGALIRDVE